LLFDRQFGGYFGLSPLLFGVRPRCFGLCGLPFVDFDLHTPKPPSSSSSSYRAPHMKLILAKELKDNELMDNDAIAAAQRKFDRAKKIASERGYLGDFLGAIKLA